MTGYDTFFVLLGWAICLVFGYHMGWNKGFSEAEEIWQPCAQRLQAMLKTIVDAADASREKL